VHIVPDESLASNDGILTFNLNEGSEYVDRVVFMPHAGENHGNVGYFKLKLLARKKKIHLTAFGHLNQFSEMGILADTVMAQPDAELLRTLYRDSFTGCRVDHTLLPKLTNARFVETHRMREGCYNFLLSRGNCPPKFGEYVTPEFREERALLIEALDTIEDEEVIDAFVWPDIYIRQSTWELFHELELPSDLICCECKLGGGCADTVREWLRTSRLPKVTGLDQTYQHELLQRVGAHYMGIQFLASWPKNWMFVCIAGSANLFSVMPVKAIVMFDSKFRNTSTEPCIRGIAQRRYGALGNEIPVLLPEQSLEKLPQFLETKKALLRSSIEKMREISYGGSA
jgi:hypothetical protein